MEGITDGPGGRQDDCDDNKHDHPPGVSVSDVEMDRDLEVMGGGEREARPQAHAANAQGREENQGEWQDPTHRKRKKWRKKKPQQKEKKWLPSIVIYGSQNKKEHLDTFVLQEKLATLELELHDAFANRQGTIVLLFETEAKQNAALAKLRTADGQARITEQFGAEARAEPGRSPHRIAFLRVPQRDGRESFKHHLERAGFTVEHIEYRGQEGRRTHTRIVTVKEGEKAKEAIRNGEVKLGLFVRYKVGEVHKRPAFQCYACQAWNDHTSATCTRTPACRKCGSSSHRSSACSVPPEKRRCINCGGPHAANSILCERRPKTEQQQKQLKRRQSTWKSPRQPNAWGTQPQRKAREESDAYRAPQAIAPQIPRGWSGRQNEHKMGLGGRYRPRPQKQHPQGQQQHSVLSQAPPPARKPPKPQPQAPPREVQAPVQPQISPALTQAERRSEQLTRIIKGLLRGISEMLIESKNYDALRHIHAHSIALDLDESEVEVLTEMTEAIPKQGRRKAKGTKQTKASNSEEEKESKKAAVGTVSSAAKRKRTVTERETEDLTTLPESTPKKPQQKKKKSALAPPAAGPPSTDSMCDDGGDLSHGSSSNTPTPT